MVVVDWIVDKWLTWRTGYDKRERIWYQWRDENIVHNADTIENMFMNFKYVFPVDHEKFFLENYPFGWPVVDDVKQYLWPQRELGENVVYAFVRGYRDPWDGCFHINDIRSEQDVCFVATNNEADAIILSLKYS